MLPATRCRDTPWNQYSKGVLAAQVVNSGTDSPEGVGSGELCKQSGDAGIEVARVLQDEWPEGESLRTTRGRVLGLLQARSLLGGNAHLGGCLGDGVDGVSCCDGDVKGESVLWKRP